jgi:acetyl esterase
VVLHGGAWWLGSSDEYVNDALCRHRCVNAACVVFAVDYRLAPEHKFPTALGDVQAALRWITGNACALGVDPDVVSIGGTSAGANLAAATALACRGNGPSLVFQLLEVPVLDLTLASMRALLASMRSRLTSGEFEPLDIDPTRLADAVRRYLHDPGQARLPLVSPIHADDLSGLPPAHIITAELDPLRDEGERYAHLLSEAGVPVTVVRYPRAIHATSFLTRTWEPAQHWQGSAATAVRRAHEQAAARGRTGPVRKR